jgi:hypothetical protein
MGIGAGLCLGVAVLWFPVAWVTSFRASGWLESQKRKPDRPQRVNDRPMGRVRSLSERMLSLWQVPALAGCAGVVLVVVAIA